MFRPFTHEGSKTGWGECGIGGTKALICICNHVEVTTKHQSCKDLKLLTIDWNDVLMNNCCEKKSHISSKINDLELFTLDKKLAATAKKS